METVFGYLAMTTSLMLVFLGLPAQIRENYRRKSCEGLNKIALCGGFCAFTMWAAYGWSKLDLFLIISQTPGSLMMLCTLIQLFIYRKQ